MSILYTSDLHFGHENVIGFDKRPFANGEEMDRVLIELWNRRVRPEDTVYMIGDLCCHNKKPSEWYLEQLTGHKILIQGNHDGITLQSTEAMKHLEGVERMLHIRDGNNHIQLCHFPLAEWNGYYKGSWHIYGHIHNRKGETYEFMKTKERALNAGCMINNYMPVSFDELVRNNKAFKESDPENSTD